jgi:hypothetical protein
MAVPASFEEADLILDKPEGMTYDQCDVLSVTKIKDAYDNPILISCWKLTKAELEEINKTGRLWIMAFGDTMTPIAVCGIKPFERKA